MPQAPSGTENVQGEQSAVDDMTDKVVAGFTDFAYRLTPDQLTGAPLLAAKRCLLDAVGCAVNAYDFAPVAALRSLARTATSTRPATLFGTREQTTPEMAAFVNGAMIRCLDFNDDYFGSEKTNAHGDTGPHPSDNIGSVLAAAQMARQTDPTTLLGIALAYEVCGQLVDEVVIRANGWDHPIFHSIATAAASARLLGLAPDRIADALRLAVVPNVCLYETRVGSISNWKGLAGPNGSRNGLFAALIAEAGITGPDLAFEGPRGFMKQVGHQFALGPFGGDGRPFRIENTYFKQFPLRYEMQLPVQLAFELRQQIDPSRDRGDAGLHGAQVRHVPRDGALAVAAREQGDRRPQRPLPHRCCPGRRRHLRGDLRAGTVRRPGAAERRRHHRADRGCRLHSGFPLEHVVPVRGPAEGRAVTHRRRRQAEGSPGPADVRRRADGQVPGPDRASTGSPSAPASCSTPSGTSTGVVRSSACST